MADEISSNNIILSFVCFSLYILIFYLKLHTQQPKAQVEYINYTLPRNKDIVSNYRIGLNLKEISGYTKDVYLSYKLIRYKKGAPPLNIDIESRIASKFYSNKQLIDKASEEIPLIHFFFPESARETNYTNPLPIKRPSNADSIISFFSLIGDLSEIDKIIVKLEYEVYGFLEIISPFDTIYTLASIVLSILFVIGNVDMTKCFSFALVFVNAFNSLTNLIPKLKSSLLLTYNITTKLIAPMIQFILANQLAIIRNDGKEASLYELLLYFVLFFIPVYIDQMQSYMRIRIVNILNIIVGIAIIIYTRLKMNTEYSNRAKIISALLLYYQGLRVITAFFGSYNLLARNTSSYKDFIESVSSDFIPFLLFFIQDIVNDQYKDINDVEPGPLDVDTLFDANDN